MARDMHFRRLRSAALLAVGLLVSGASGTASATSGVSLTHDGTPVDGTILRVGPGDDVVFLLQGAAWPGAPGQALDVRVTVHYSGFVRTLSERLVDAPPDADAPFEREIAVVVPDFGSLTNGPFEVGVQVRDLQGVRIESFVFHLRPEEIQVATVENAVLAVASLGWLLWLRRALRLLVVTSHSLERLESRAEKSRGRVRAAFARLRGARGRLARHTVGLAILAAAAAGQALQAAGLRMLTLGQLVVDAAGAVVAVWILAAFVAGFVRPVASGSSPRAATEAETGADPADVMPAPS